MRTPTKAAPLKCAFVAFKDFELLDLFGPWELLGTAANQTKLFKTQLLTASKDSLELSAGFGPIVLANDSIFNKSEFINTVDVVIIVGGLGTRTLQHDDEFIGRLREVCETASTVLTVCTGAMLLAKTGLLDGVRATTNKFSFEMIQSSFPQVKWEASARWVHEGKFWTSSGVSAGIDLMNAFLAEAAGPQVARHACVGAEYAPSTEPTEDPFAKNIGKTSPIIQPLPDRPVVRIGLIVYDKFEMLDTFGPLEIFAMANRILQPSGRVAFELVTIAEDRTIQSVLGPAVIVDKTFDQVPDPVFDLLLVPGGIGCIREVHNASMIQFLRRAAEAAGLVMTVCSGSAVLAATGLLDGRRVTTNKISFDFLVQYGPAVDWQDHARWVIDGKYHTSSGVSAGTDLAVRVLANLYGDDVTSAVLDRAEYNWNSDPEFDEFSLFVKESLLWRSISNRTQGALLRVVYGAGFACNQKMYFVTDLLMPLL
eukprot:c5091_g1_i1.p1 GENE.c5091_g1_i1~~c5091_g1_i1.p1  ORF type:complete len:482 (-),score=121.12 c5091_g1_i1:43-1488(-)